MRILINRTTVLILNFESEIKKIKSIFYPFLIFWNFKQEVLITKKYRNRRGSIMCNSRNEFIGF